jgi:hypothetical protein
MPRRFQIIAVALFCASCTVLAAWLYADDWPQVVGAFRKLNIEGLANLIECPFWIVVAWVIFFAGLRTSRRGAGYSLAVAPVLVVFGLSDFVESGTGAWWSPWWLFLWKAGCVILLALIVIGYYRARRQARHERAIPLEKASDQA